MGSLMKLYLSNREVEVTAYPNNWSSHQESRNGMGRAAVGQFANTLSSQGAECLTFQLTVLLVNGLGLCKVGRKFSAS